MLEFRLGWLSQNIYETYVPSMSGLRPKSCTSMRGTHGKLILNKVFLAAGNRHHVTEACVLQRWTLLDFGRKKCCWRTKFCCSACRLQPPEQPYSALFCSTGTGGAAMAGKRAKRDPAAATASS